MKKSLTIFCMLLLSVSVWAQKVTEKDLQGNWKLTTYEVSGASLDVASGKVTLTKNDEPIMAAMGGKLTADMESYAEGLRMSSLEIVGNNFNQIVVDSVRNGSFTLEEKNGVQIIKAKFDNGTSDEIPFKITDGKLCLFNFKNAKKYTYSKL